MSTLWEIYRHSFPKRLRFDKASQVLYAQCYSISKQYKHRKYIPKRAIQDVLDGYTAMPGAPWLQLPIVRHVLLVRLLNGMRGFLGRPLWLYNRNVEEEYRNLATWMEKAGTNKTAAAAAAATGGGGGKRGATAGTSTSSPSSLSAAAAGASPSSAASFSELANSAPGRRATAQHRLEGMVERERFEREVLLNFHVATFYQRTFRVGVAAVIFLCFLVYASVRTDILVYLYLTYYLRYGRAEVLEYFRAITAHHTVSEVPPAYAGILPPPCVRRVGPTGDVSYSVNIVEMVMAKRNVTVFAIPCPQMGDRHFFEQVGRVASACDAVVLEGVTLDRVDKLAPAVFLPLKTNTFPALGVHHRFLDILRSNSDDAPPMLYPAGAEVSWRAYLKQALIPYELRCVYNPTQLSATKGEARVGWGRLRQVLEEVGEPVTGAADQERYVVCLPWTLHQIVNLEASLIKYGFTVRNVYPVHWQREDHMGENFCEHFNIA